MGEVDPKLGKLIKRISVKGFINLFDIFAKSNSILVRLSVLYKNLVI